MKSSPFVCCVRWPCKPESLILNQDLLLVATTRFVVDEERDEDEQQDHGQDDQDVQTCIASNNLSMRPLSRFRCSRKGILEGRQLFRCRVLKVQSGGNSLIVVFTYNR